MSRDSSHGVDDQSITSQDRISLFVLFLFILSILFALSFNIFSDIFDMYVFELFNGLIVFINIWGLGFLVNNLLFPSILENDNKNTGNVYSNSSQIIFRYLLFPTSFGMIIICLYGLLAVIAFNMFDLSDITQRISSLFIVFYLSEFLFTLLFTFFKFNIIKSLLAQPRTLNKLVIHFNALKSQISFNYYRLIVFSILSLVILGLSMFLGEINYDFEALNITLVFLFFLAIIVLIFFYIQSKNRTPYLDMILIFILTFSLAHLFISRGPTIVGRTDIQNEFFYAQDTLSTINWDPNKVEDNYNTIVSISILPMILNVLFRIKLEFFFELVNPGIFALFNIVNYIISKKIHSRYSLISYSEANETQDSSPYYVLFSILLIIFIRSYTHIIAASARIVVAYFLFSIFCLIIINDELISGFKRLPILFLFLSFVLLSHWGTFLFGVAVIVTSFIVFLFFLGLKKYRILPNLSKVITKERIKRLFFNSIFIGAFAILTIIWFLFIAPQVIIFLQERVLPAIEKSSEEGIENFIPELISLLTTYRIINTSNPIIFLETIINILFGIILILSNFSKIIRILKLENPDTSDFFGVSSFFAMGLMLIVPVLSSFYSPLRIGMQFWPFIAPVFFVKIRFKRDISLQSHFPAFLQKMLSIKISSVMTIFLFLLLSFHQGIVYEITYNSDITTPSEVLEVGESLSLVFRNYGVEAWRWVLTESDLQAIMWLNLQQPVPICADLSRTYMLRPRINRTPDEDTRAVISHYPLYTFFETNDSRYLWRKSYFFFSSQNIDSGSMFFSSKPNSIYKLISELTNLNAFLVYSNATQIYYLP